MDFDSIDSPRECTLLIAFCDPTNYARTCRERASGDVLRLMSGYYELVGDVIEPAGGKVVKFMGDGALIVFPQALSRQAVAALQELQGRVGRYFEGESVDSVLQIKAHLGRVSCGRVGTRGDKRFDVFGDHVNRTALLPSGAFVMSEELERELAG